MRSGAIFWLRSGKYNFVRKKLARGGKNPCLEVLFSSAQISVWHTNEAAYSRPESLNFGPWRDEKGLINFGPA